MPNRKKEYLLNYFQKIPLEERKKVKYACSDMYEVYRDVVHKVFPEAKHLLDYFHLSQDFHKKMNEVRIKVMKGYKDNKASMNIIFSKNSTGCYSKIQKMKINMEDCLM